MRRLDLDLDSFREFIECKRLICYGSGAAGVRAINMLENWGKGRDILTFVDSNEEKWNHNISNGINNYPIVSLREAMEKVDRNTVFLITCISDILEIRAMLNRYTELNDIECFSLVEISQQQLLSSDYDMILKESTTNLIPKKIHYCWLGGNKPPFIQRMVDSWHEKCPDYEIVEWNEHNYDFTKNSYMREAYEAQVWGFVPDYARLDIIYHNGGIYLDTDVDILQKPDDLLYQKNFFISDGSFQVDLGAGFGAMPGMALLKEFMEYYEDVSFVTEEGTLNKLPCVAHQYNVLRKYGMKINDRFQIVQGANIYPMIMCGTNVYTMQMRKTEKTYFAHYGTASWMKKDTIEKRRKIRDYFQQDGLESYEIS